MHLLNVFTLLVSLLTVCLAMNGDMTWYTGLTKNDLTLGQCSLSTYTIPSGLYGMAIPTGIYAGSANCGACAAVTYNGKTIKTIVIDECGGCPTSATNVDLFTDGFSQLADLGAGRLPVTWEWIDCNHPGNVWFHVMQGSNVAWFAVQAVNHNQPITSMQVSIDGGNTFADMDRRDDGFFKARGTLGGTELAVKAWASGQSVVATGVAVEGGSFEAGGNFS